MSLSSESLREGRLHQKVKSFCLNFIELKLSVRPFTYTLKDFLQVKYRLFLLYIILFLPVVCGIYIQLFLYLSEMGYQTYLKDFPVEITSLHQNSTKCPETRVYDNLTTPLPSAKLFHGTGVYLYVAFRMFFNMYSTWIPAYMIGSGAFFVNSIIYPQMTNYMVRRWRALDDPTCPDIKYTRISTVIFLSWAGFLASDWSLFLPPASSYPDCADLQVVRWLRTATTVLAMTMALIVALFPKVVYPSTQCLVEFENAVLQQRKCNDAIV